MNPRLASERLTRLLRPVCTARHPLSCPAAVLRRTTALRTSVQAAEGCARSKAGRVRPLSTTTNTPRDRSDFVEYDDMNKMILALGKARDAEGLLNIVRIHRGDGEPEALDFHHTNCCLWLDKWSEMDQKWLWGNPPPEVMQVLRRALLMLDKRRLAFVPREVSTLALTMCSLHYKWDPSELPPPLQMMDAVTAWCLKAQEGLDDWNTLDLGCLATGYFKLNYDPGKRMLEMLANASSARQRVEEFSMMNLLTLQQIFVARQQHPGRALMEGIANECLRRKWRDMTIHFVGPSFITFVYFRYHPPKAWLDGAANTILQSPDEEMTPAQVSSVLSGYNFYNYNPGYLVLRKLSYCCEQRLEEFSSVRLAYFLRAYKKFRDHPGKRLLPAIIERLRVQGVDQLTSHHLVTILTTCAVFNHYPGMPMMDEVAATLATRPPDPRAMDRFAIALNVYQHFRHHPGEELLNYAARQCVEVGFEGWDAEDLIKLLHTMATFTHHPGDAFLKGAIDVMLKHGWEKMSLRSCRILVWSLVVLQTPVPAGLMIAMEPKVMAVVGLLQDLRSSPSLARAPEGQEEDEEQEAGNGAATVPGKVKEIAEDMRLLRAALYVSPMCSRSFDRPRRALQKSLNTLRAQLGEVAKVWEAPDVQHDLRTALRRRNRHLREGAWVGGDRIALDVMIDLQKGRQVGVKIHGPTAHCINRPHAPLGQTLLEWRVLNKAREQGDLSSWVSMPSVTPEALAKVGVAVRNVLQRNKEEPQEVKVKAVVQAEIEGCPTETEQEMETSHFLGNEDREDPPT